MCDMTCKMFSIFVEWDKFDGQLTAPPTEWTRNVTRLLRGQNISYEARFALAASWDFLVDGKV